MFPRYSVSSLWSLGYVNDYALSGGLRKRLRLYIMQHKSVFVFPTWLFTFHYHSSSDYLFPIETKSTPSDLFIPFVSLLDHRTYAQKPVSSHLTYPPIRPSNLPLSYPTPADSEHTARISVSFTVNYPLFQNCDTTKNYNGTNFLLCFQGSTAKQAC